MKKPNHGYAQSQDQIDWLEYAMRVLESLPPGGISLLARRLAEALEAVYLDGIADGTVRSSEQALLQSDLDAANLERDWLRITLVTMERERDEALTAYARCCASRPDSAQCWDEYVRVLTDRTEGVERSHDEALTERQRIVTFLSRYVERAVTDDNVSLREHRAMVELITAIENAEHEH